MCAFNNISVVNSVAITLGQLRTPKGDKGDPGRVFRDIVVLAEILIEILDTFLKIQSTLRDMVTQSFLKWDKFWRYLPISDRYFSKY